MKDPKVTSPDGTRLTIGPARLSYVHVFEKWNPDGKEEGGKYCVTILIPKGEQATVDGIEKAVRAAASTPRALKKFGGAAPKKLAKPLQDGDEKEKGGPEFEGCWYINAKTDKRPGLMARDGSAVVSADEDEFYSGCWAYASLSFYAYEVSGNRGVGCALNGLKKYRDDDRLGGGGGVTESDFDGMDDDDDDM